MTCENTALPDDPIVERVEMTSYHIRTIGQILIMVGEGLDTPGDLTGAAFIHLGQELLVDAQKILAAVPVLIKLEKMAEGRAS